MRQGGDSFAQARRAWLKRAMLCGAALPLVIRDALAAGERASAMADIQGEVLINGSRASVGDAVSPGDSITTAAGSHAVFVLGNDAFLVRENSDLRTAAQSVLAGALRLWTGKLLSVFGRGSQNIVTATATIGVRGTGIYIEAETERTYVCTCYGRVDLQANNMPEARETVQTTHHDAPRYVYAQGDMPIRMIEAAPVINHTDAELILLEALLGRTPPFVGSVREYRY